MPGRFCYAIGVLRNTVGGYEAERAQPRIVLNAWALATGVPIAWLRTGESPRPGDPDRGSHAVRPEGLEPPTF